MTLMEEVQERSVSQKQRERDEAIAKHVQKEADRLASIKSGKDRAIREIPEIAQSILKAVDRGLKSVDVTIQHWDREYSLDEYQSSFLQALNEHFTKEGFKTKVRDSEMDPCGSDSLFDHTVYSTYLTIYW